jgi:hypothetical protein
VKHWHTLTIFAVFTSLARGDDFKTISGKEYKDVLVSRVEADGIVLKSKSGITKIYFTELPKNVQERFHRDSAQNAHITANEQADRRLGGTADQFAVRYGAPIDTAATKISDQSSPLLEGAIHHTYEYEGWRIRAAFLEPNGPAVRMDYSKSFKAGISPTIQDYELQAIMSANTPPGTTWKQIPFKNPNTPDKLMNKAVEAYFGNALGQKMWQRSDGAILWLRSKMTVRLELPAAREFEAKLKAEKEQKARQSVPHF